MTGLAVLDVSSLVSYVVAVAFPALDALIPALPSETDATRAVTAAAAQLLYQSDEARKLWARLIDGFVEDAAPVGPASVLARAR